MKPARSPQSAVPNDICDNTTRENFEIDNRASQCGADLMLSGPGVVSSIGAGVRQPKSLPRTVRLDCEDDDEQSEIWERLYEQILSLLSRYGVDNAFGDGEYFLVDDNYGWKRHHVEVHQFHMFRPEIVFEVRSLLESHPEWQIVMQIGVVGTEDWPNMGLTIRKHELIEVLRREMLPDEFKQYQYPGARPGTEYD